MAALRDLREWIALLEREGELVRVDVEVDPHLEVTEIVDRTVKSGGPALLFDHPKGSDHPLLLNQFGTQAQQKREVAAELAAVLAFSAISNNDKVGLIAFTDRVERFVPQRKGTRHVLRLIRDVLFFQPKRRGTSIREGTTCV